MNSQTEPSDSQLPATVAEAVPAVQPAGDSAEKKRNNYNRLVRQTKLVALLLERVDFKILPEAIGLNKALLTRDLNGKTEVMTPGAEDGTCIANIVWNINMRFKKKIIIKCVASYIVTYEGMRGFSPETVQMFVDTVGKAASYAYFRAMYAHLDWSANLGSPPLPILQFQAKV